MTITVGIDAAEELLPVSSRQQHLLPLDEREVLVFLLAVARQFDLVVVVHAVVADVPQANVSVCERTAGVRNRYSQQVRAIGNNCSRRYEYDLDDRPESPVTSIVLSKFVAMALIPPLLLRSTHTYTLSMPFR